VITPERQLRLVRRIFTRVAPVYDLLNHLLSLGEDRRWRRFLARAVRPGPTGRVLDVATGTGDVALALATSPARPRVIGLDLLPAMLAPAQTKAARRGLSLPLVCGDALHLPFPEACFDAVTIAFGIRNIPHRVAALAEMARVLVPGGRLYVLELATPTSPRLRRLYRVYLQGLLPRLGGLISRQGDAYQYLADTILAFPAPAQFRAELRAAGLVAPRSYALTRGVAWLHVAERPQAG